MAMLQARPLQRFVMLELPHALPVVLTGMEVAVVMAMIGAIVGEFIGGNEGLGYLAVKCLQELSIANLFGVVVTLTWGNRCKAARVRGNRRRGLPENGGPYLLNGFEYRPW